jgi:hypothetical protein
MRRPVLIAAAAVALTLASTAVEVRGRIGVRDACA